MTDELTSEEKTILLASMDSRSLGNYDHKFYEKMREIPPLDVEEVDDRVRRAIARFIMDGIGEESNPDNGGFVMMGFLHGYMVGRKLKRDIRRKMR